MKIKVVVSSIMAMLVLLFVDVQGTQAHNRGTGKRIKSSSSINLVHRKPFVHRRFIHRRFIHRPGVILKFHSPYYYRRNYYYDYGYYSKPSYSESSLSIVVIVDMTSRGVPDEVIISEIKRTNSYFYLNVEIIAYLKENKVSNRVIDYMLTRR